MTHRKMTIFLCLLTTLGVLLATLGCGSDKSKDKSSDKDMADKDNADNKNGGPLNVLSQTVERSVRQASSTNLKQIGLAFYNYASDYGHFLPSAIVDRQGKPLLSWRVALLPYIEQDNLYKQFKLNAPWDSPHNKKLLAMMPRTYRIEKLQDTNATETYYQVFTGPRTPFATPQSRVKINGISDGTSNTLMVVEAAAPVPWTKPADIPFDPNGSPPKVGGLYRSAPGFNAVLFSGATKWFPGTVPPAKLRSLIMPADGK